MQLRYFGTIQSLAKVLHYGCRLSAGYELSELPTSSYNSRPSSRLPKKYKLLDAKKDGLSCSTVGNHLSIAWETHLGNAAGGKSLGVERLEELLQGLSKSCLDSLTGGLEAVGGRVIV